MVSNKKFSKVFDIVSNFEKKSSSFLSLRKKQAQDTAPGEEASNLLGKNYTMGEDEWEAETIDTGLDGVEARLNKLLSSIVSFVSSNNVKLPQAQASAFNTIKSLVKVNPASVKSDFLQILNSLKVLKNFGWKDQDLQSKWASQIGAQLDKALSSLKNRPYSDNNLSRKASIKNAQVMSSVEQEAALKRDIEELMTKGVNSTVRPYWQTLVSAVNGLKKVGKLPGNLEALDYYQVIVHGGVAFARRVAFASKFPQVISLLAVECQKENILDAKQRGQLTSLSQALNEPCEMIKSKYDSLVKVQEKTKSTFDETERDFSGPKDSVNTQPVAEGRMSVQQATSAVRALIRELSVDGSRQDVLEKFNVMIKPYLKEYSSDPSFNSAVRELVNAGIPADPTSDVLASLRRLAQSVSGLKGEEKLKRGYQVVQKLLNEKDSFKGNKEFTKLVNDLVGELGGVSDSTLKDQLNKLRS